MTSQQIWMCGFFASKHKGYTWSPTVCRDLTYICLSFPEPEESGTTVIPILKMTRGMEAQSGTLACPRTHSLEAAGQRAELSLGLFQKKSNCNCLKAPNLAPGLSAQV